MKRKVLPRHFYCSSLLPRAAKRITGFIGLLLLMSANVFGQPFPYPYPTVDFTNTIEPITRVSVGSIDNRTDGHTYGAPGLEDFTHLSTNVQPGETIGIELEGNTDGEWTNYFTVFIDWNQNGHLDNFGEIYEIGSIRNSTGNDNKRATGDISVPLGALEGYTRMRVIKNYNSSPSDPGGTYSYGQAEDYTLVVGAPSACQRPNGFSVVDISPSSVNLSWVGDGGTFEIKWGAAGFDVDNEGLLVTDITATTQRISGLTAGTGYHAYVRRNCDTEGYSDWVGPVVCLPGYYYTAGDIPTRHTYSPGVGSDFCAPEPTLTIEVPIGYQLSGLTVKYDMVARNSAWKSEQASILYSTTLGVGEESVTFGTDESAGMQSYSRSVSFADGATGDVTFALRTWRTWDGGEGSGPCNTYYNYVPSGSWQLIPEFEPLPSCLFTSGLVVGSISRHGATVSWEAAGLSTEVYEYYYATTNTPPDAATRPSGEAENTFVDLSDLDIGTTYYVWVRANCGDGDYSNWVGTSFTTSAPWSERFDTAYYYALPAGWQSPSEDWTVDRRESLLDAESYFVNTYFSNGESRFMITNTIGPVEAGDVFTFIYRNAYYNLPYAAAPAGSFEVTVAVSTDGGETFHEEDRIITDGAHGWQPFMLNMSAYAGEAVQLRIGVEAIGEIYSYYFGLDNFYVGPPQCPQPLNPSVSAVTPTSAVISWSEPLNIPEGGYQYYYAETATPPTAATDVSGTATSTSASLSDLSPGERYYFWVRAVCGEGVYGAWSIAGTFGTELELSSPWAEDFDASTAAPPGWETAHWQVNAGSGILNSEGNIVYSSLSNSAGNWNKTLTTPNIRVEAGDVLSFLYATKDDFSSGNPAEGRFTVSISEDYGVHYTDIETVTLNSTVTWRMFSYALDDYEGKHVKVRIVAEYRSWSYQVGFDQFRMGPSSDCPILSTVSATTVGYTGAMVEWEDTGTDYEYYLVDSNMPPNVYTGSYERTSDTQVHFDDLEESKTYYFWIRTYCDDDSHGEWGPLAIFTTPTRVSTPWTEDFPTEGAPQGWEITGWQVGMNPYFSELDGNAIYKELYYNFDVGQRTFTTLHVGDVQPGDQLSFRYQLTTYINTPPEAGSGNFTVAIATDIGGPYTDIGTVENNGIGGWQEFSYPLDDYVGETIQVRIVATWSVGTYLIAFDDFSVGSGTDCATLTGLAASDITANSATLAWNEPVVVPAGYDYYLATDETIPDAAAEPSGSISLPEVELTDLAPGQTYYWWVRAVCAEDAPGAWSAPQSFTTVQVTPTPWLEGFSSAATPADWEINGWYIGNHDDIDGGAGYLLYYNLYSSDPSAQFTTSDVGIIQTGDELSFRFKLVNYYTFESAPGLETGEFTVKISTDFGEHYETLETVPNDGTTGWRYLRLDLSDYAGKAIRIQVDAAQEGEADYYLAFDDFYVGPPPSCPPVVDIAISEQTTTSARISWDKPDDIPANGYSYYISTWSTAPTESTVGQNIEQPVVVLVDLIPATTYYVWVRAECADDDSGSWGASASFTTGRIYYVREGASGTGDSWDDASGVLQEVIDVASPGSEVWVAAGTYRPETDTGMPPRGFEMKSGVAVYGGFPAGGGDWTQRDWRENQTVLKKHLTEELPIVSGYSVDNTAILDGFIITEGNTSRGGGIYNWSASPTFRNLEINGNKALWGGGVYNSDGSAPRFINVAITHNESSYAGAGMSNMDTGDPIILTNVVISNNKTGNGYNGGAMENADASLILTNVTIAGNTSENSSVYNDNSSVVVRNTIAWGNSNGNAPINGIRQGGAGNVVTVDYSLVEGLTTAGSRGNIDGDTDPGFLSAGAGDYRLRESSPVIDAGNDGYFAPDAEPDLSDIDVDVAGNPRFYEGSTIDLGAYEYNENQPPLPITIRYVKTVTNGGAPGNNGLDWETASSNLQAMIDASMEGDEVWVAAGDYHAVYYDRPHITFVLKEGVAVYGGFPANGGDENQRDWKANETALIGYGGGGYSVISNDNLTAQTILDGFIIQGGDTDRGGGIYNWNASPTLRNLWIKDNLATWGGGIYNTDASSPEITDVEISDNTVEYSGGGMLNGEGSSPILTRVVIRDNTATDLPTEDGVAGGGGIFHQSSGTLKLTEVTVIDNTSNSDAGGIYLADEAPALYLENCLILGNIAQRYGGGLYIHQASTAATLVNTVIGDNQALRGGGIYNDGNLILLNATLGANKATNGGGLYHAGEAAAAEIENSIVSGNYKADGVTADNVYNAESGESTCKYTNSLITGSGGSGSGSWNETYGADGGGNVGGDADFLSTDRTSVDYLWLSACSPAIDGGSDELYENGGRNLALDSDAAGNPRWYGGSIDMGAFERQLPPSNTVAVPTAGTYGIGQTLTFEVTFSAPVSVTGTPYIPLIVGGQNRKASFESGSASNKLKFQYQIVEEDEDTEGIGMASAIALDGGEIIYTDSEEDADLILCGNVEVGTLIDGVKPELTVVSIASDNTADVTLAKPGDEITLTFIADEAIGLPTVTIAGNPATVSALDDDDEVPHSWQANYTMTADDEEGSIAFTINYEDMAGNGGEIVAATTDESTVIFDKTPPQTPSLLAVERGDGKLVLSWDANTEPDFALYRLYMGTAADDLSETVAITDIVTTSYAHDDLANGTEYHYRIAAVDQAGNESEWSDILSEIPMASQTISFDVLDDKVYGDEPFALSATATSGLAVQFESSDNRVASIGDDGVTVTIRSAGTVTITATQPGNTAFEPAIAVPQELVITKAKPVIAWASPAAITYGTALDDTQLNATADVAGLFTYSPEAGTVLEAGTGHPLTVTFTPEDTDNYEAATAEVTIDVRKATPVLTWAAPAAITYGTALDETQLNATADVAGLFTYSPAAGTVLEAGTSHPLTVTFAPADTDNYEAATAEVTIDVRKATPVLTWAAPAAITYGTALDDTQLNATADVAGLFTYSPAAGTVLESGTGHPLAVTFTPEDTDNYESATAEVTIDVRKAPPLITWPDPVAITYGTALDDTQLNATADVAGLFTYSPAAGTVLESGTGHRLTVTFTPEDTDNYEPVTAEVAIDVLKAKPVITWTNLAAITYGTALDEKQLNATADVAGLFTYSPAAGTVLESGTGHPLAVTFTPDDTDNYEPVTAEVTIDVLKATPIITWASPAAITYGTALDDTQLNAEADVDGLFTYSPAAGTVLESGTGHRLTVTFTPADTDNYEPVTAEVTIDVKKATPVVTWVVPAAITYGTALDKKQLNATADVAGLFTYSPAAGTVLEAGTSHPLTAMFVPDDTNNYEPVTADQIVAVHPRSITLIAEAQEKVYGDDDPEDYAYMLGDGSTLAVTDNLGDIVSSTTREAGEGVGSYSFFLELNGAKAANYDIIVDANNNTFTITPKSLTISLSATPEVKKTYDGTLHAELSAGNYRVHGVLGDDDVYVSGSASYEQTEAGENIPVWVRDFVLHGADAIHYVVETASAETVGRIVWGAVGEPTNLSASAGDKQVALSWQSPPDNGQPVMQYVIQFSPDNGETWVVADRIPAALTQAIIVGLQNNRPYDFRVAAANDTGTGPFGERIAGVVPKAPVLNEGKLPDPPFSEAVVITNGEVETVTLEVVDSEYLRLSSGDFEFKLATMGVNGNRIPISEIDAIIRMVRGTNTSVYVSGSGFEPGTVITVYVFSDPQLLGYIDVRPDGSFEGSLLLPNNLAIGRHTIQANGIVAGGGVERSVSLGMLVVANRPQDIYFDTLGDVSYGQNPILLNATSSSGLEVTYTVTDPEGKPTARATIEHGNELHIRGAGDVLITATQSGNGEYAAATPVARPLHVSRAVLDVSVADASRVYGEDDPVFELLYSGFVNNDDVSSLTRQPEARSEATSASAPGTYAVSMAGGISDNYLFRYHAATLTITKAHQVINFNAPTAEINRTIGSIPLDVAATSGLPVTLAVDNTLAATLTGTTLNIHRLGTVQITATQAGDSNYLPADPVTVTVRIVDPSARIPIRVHQAVSPNGDGVNEWLIIEGIRDYPENRVTVLNRNGTVLWEASGYDNDKVAFRGISTGQLRLPAGTYFYIVELKIDGKWEHQKGYFVLRY